jgi:hypothetical protein
MLSLWTGEHACVADGFVTVTLVCCDIYLTSLIPVPQVRAKIISPFDVLVTGEVIKHSVLQVVQQNSENFDSRAQRRDLFE